jgi:hypothetical protein
MKKLAGTPLGMQCLCELLSWNLAQLHNALQQMRRHHEQTMAISS